MTDNQIEEHIEESVLQNDITILNDLNVSDQVMKTLAAEHLSRSVTLAKAVEPTMGKALLLTAAGVLISAAKEIEAATYQEPELINV